MPDNSKQTPMSIARHMLAYRTTQDNKQKKNSTDTSCKSCLLVPLATYALGALQQVCSTHCTPITQQLYQHESLALLRRSSWPVWSSLAPVRQKLLPAAQLSRLSSSSFSREVRTDDRTGNPPCFHSHGCGRRYKVCTRPCDATNCQCLVVQARQVLEEQ